MAVYVDDMFSRKLGKYGRMKMSHMMADTTEELLHMVDLIGVKRKWIQYPNTPKEHFDISFVYRQKAIKYGAIPITMREMVIYRKKDFSDLQFFI